MPCRPLPDTSCSLDSVHSLKSSLLSKEHGDSLQMNVVLVWIFTSDLLPSFAWFTESHGPRSACFLNVQYLLPNL